MYIKEAIIERALRLWEALPDQTDQVMMLCIAEHTEVDIDQMIQTFNAANIPFFGGLFPKLISGTSPVETGAIVNFLPSSHDIYVIENKPEKGGVDAFPLEAIVETEEEDLTVITLVDGLMPNISETLYQIQNKLGEKGSFFGGGAGSLSLQQAPCLFCKTGFFQDATLLCLVKGKTKTGIRHGWEKLYGPLVATQTEGNIVRELNWQNAFEVYHQIVSEDSGRSFGRDDFFDTSKGYPFGIYQEGAEDLVRDPIAVSETGELICVGDVPQNAVIHILKGETENLISAASQASRDVNLQEEKPDFLFLVDCISRVIFLEDHFSDELEAAIGDLQSGHDVSLEGILSLGEIYSNGTSLLTFYNKTFVLNSLFL